MKKENKKQTFPLEEMFVEEEDTFSKEYIECFLNLLYQSK